MAVRCRTNRLRQHFLRLTHPSRRWWDSSRRCRVRPDGPDRGYDGRRGGDHAHEGSEGAEASAWMHRPELSGRGLAGFRFLDR